MIWSTPEYEERMNYAFQKLMLETIYISDEKPRALFFAEDDDENELRKKDWILKKWTMQ